MHPIKENLRKSNGGNLMVDSSHGGISKKDDALKFLKNDQYSQCRNELPSWHTVEIGMIGMSNEIKS
jgi:hypothetical protein